MNKRWLSSLALCHLQAIPYLPEDPIASISLDLLPVSRVMKSPVVTFQVRLGLTVHADGTSAG